MKIYKTKTPDDMVIVRTQKARYHLISSFEALKTAVSGLPAGI